jgi:NitT/TauT family transport system permease protein
MEGSIVNERARPLLVGAASLLTVAVVWEVLADLGAINPFIAGSPTRVASEFAREVTSGELLRQLRVSLGELAATLAIAIAIGVPTGVVLGWYRRVSLAFEPLVWLGYAAPVLAMYAVFTLIFGLGSGAVIAMAVTLTVPPIIINTASGVRNVDQKVIQASRSFGASDAQLFAKVVIPGSLPMLMAGMRLAIGRALTGVVIGEFFAGTSGLGWAISYYAGMLETTKMLASVVVIGVIGVLLTMIVGLLERRVDAWRVQPT